MIVACAALRNHLDIKRVLLSDNELRDVCGRVKMALADREYRQIRDYAMAKNEILWKILEKTGWSDEDLEKIRKANR
jgi:hypothetical protein